MTAPLVSEDVDLRGMPYMPLDTARLLDSDLFALATGDEFKAALALWCKAWQQVPASSLPNDERVLAHLSGAGAKWKKVRETAMRGFLLCDDGRFYHPVIAEKALDAWSHRLAQREKGKRRHVNDPPKSPSPAKPEPSRGLTTAEPQLSRSPASEVEVEVNGKQRTTTPTSNPLPIAPKKARRPEEQAVANIETWNAYSGAYAGKYGVPPVRNAKTNKHMAMLVERIGSEEAPRVAAFYLTHNRSLYLSARHCTDLLIKDAEALRMEWVTGTSITDKEARMRDSTQARGNVFSNMLPSPKDGTHG